MSSPIRVHSEIDVLKTVLLKRPGPEIENLTPEYLETLLFDEIPYLRKMIEEHNAFAAALSSRGIEVLYLEKLLEESLTSNTLKEGFVHSVLAESNHLYGYVRDRVQEYLLELPTADMVEQIMGGVRKTEPGLKNISEKKSLLASVAAVYPFYITPMPNLYFTRDPAVVIGDGVSISKMNKPARRKESMFIRFILKYHRRFSSRDIPIWMDRDFSFSIEGGDILVLSNEAIAIGISERTSAAAIEQLAKNLFANQQQVKKVMAVDIPKKRAFMHLDTVFTMLDKNLFSIHPEIRNKDDEIYCFVIEADNSEGGIQITAHTTIESGLKEILGLEEVRFVPCAGGDVIAAPREQWSDGTNTLAVAPGVVVTYDRNHVTNRIFREEYGLEVIEIPSGELSRGRGGPRCMSMPLLRES